MQDLRRTLAQEDTVLFVGSGLSMWSGLPSWARLIDELADYLESAGTKAHSVRAEAARGDLLQAASYGFDKLTKQQVGAFIRGAWGIARPHEIHRKLVCLGPRCYITTNYDNLIEESIRLWRPERSLRVVTNRQLTETAEIVHARATDFLFKPHGDAADSDSIVLTREQYRQLQTGGERQAALESVKLLLASRPVIYIGFGLRDPDFIYVRDILANIYKGGTRDHYAILPDIDEAEADYWRRNFGIHIQSYATNRKADGSLDHGALLQLLDGLRRTDDDEHAATDPAPRDAETVLALARHAARLARFPKQEPEFPIRVSAEGARMRPTFRSRRAQFDHASANTFLQKTEEHAVLIGLPGAGKTYSLSRGAAYFAERLHDACLADSFDESAVVVPILVDLKLYTGSLVDLVKSSLPAGIDFDALATRFRLRVFADCFNEMPRDQWESSDYESDFSSFLALLGKGTLIISSRTSDGLSKLEIPVYSLDHIENEFIERQLDRLQGSVGGKFAREIVAQLAKPFFFQLFARGDITLPANPHPRDFYTAFFGQLSRAFEARFGHTFDVAGAFATIAYDAITRGEEIFALSTVLETLSSALAHDGHSCSGSA